MEPLSPSRSPHGERGLKSRRKDAEAALRESLPAWGAWIEIGAAPWWEPLIYVAPRMGSVD